MKADIMRSDFMLKPLHLQFVFINNSASVKYHWIIASLYQNFIVFPRRAHASLHERKQKDRTKTFAKSLNHISNDHDIYRLDVQSSMCVWTTFLDKKVSYKYLEKRSYLLRRSFLWGFKVEVYYHTVSDYYNVHVMWLHA